MMKYYIQKLNALAKAEDDTDSDDNEDVIGK